jgi:hypothetical protein
MRELGVKKYINKFHNTEGQSKYSIDELDNHKMWITETDPDYEYYCKVTRAYKRLKNKLFGIKECTCWGFVEVVK